MIQRAHRRRGFEWQGALQEERHDDKVLHDGDGIQLRNRPAREKDAFILNRQGRVLIHRNIQGNGFWVFLKLAQPAFANKWGAPGLTAAEFLATEAWLHPIRKCLS